MILLSIFLVIGLALSVQQISQNLAGNNLWYYDPDTTIWNLNKECGVQIIRIGGHAYAKNLSHKDTLVNWVKQIQLAVTDALVQVSQYQSPGVAAESHEIVGNFWY